MRRPIGWLTAAALLIAAGATAFAQNSDVTIPDPTLPPVDQPLPPDAPSYDPSAPNPVTGETVPLPVPPPADPAEAFTLPDCAPPRCGTPQIMQ
ncbi:hypothetical protein [Ancylobacter terrae]|uniref:hypothetical protein n=1 Tax=Ancylobacter sp. sgz301288 TaxID=3342077 RepID=UPI00385D24A5